MFCHSLPQIFPRTDTQLITKSLNKYLTFKLILLMLRLYYVVGVTVFRQFEMFTQSFSAVSKLYVNFFVLIQHEMFNILVVNRRIKV